MILHRISSYNKKLIFLRILQQYIRQKIYFLDLLFKQFLEQFGKVCRCIIDRF